MSAGNKLQDQDKALTSFFESLLRDVEAYAEREEVSSLDDQADETPSAAQTASSSPESGDKGFSVVSPVSQPDSQKSDAVRTQVEVRTDTQLYSRLPPVAPPQVEPEPKQEIPQPITNAEEASSTETADTSRPEWAESEFQAMLFKVAGLTLAVPLVDLNGVIEWDPERVTEMPGHADFYLGLINHLGRNVPLVDTARLVLPDEKRRLLAGENPQERLTRVVLINDSQYGLACDEVNEVIVLQPDDVRWRTERTQRRWLAGTVIAHMCALIDATAFARILAERESVGAIQGHD